MAGIALPILARGKEAAKVSVVTQQLSQIGHSVVLYANDYDGLTPLAVDDTSLELIETGVGRYGALDRRAQLVPLQDLVASYGTSTDLFRSPRDMGPEANSWIRRRLGESWSSYVYDDYSPLAGRSISSIEDPSQTTLLMEMPSRSRFPQYDVSPQPCLRADQSISRVLGSVCDHGFPGPRD
jgi:hypothetical protein